MPRSIMFYIFILALHAIEISWEEVSENLQGSRTFLEEMHCGLRTLLSGYLTYRESVDQILSEILCQAVGNASSPHFNWKSWTE